MARDIQKNRKMSKLQRAFQKWKNEQMARDIQKKLQNEQIANDIHPKTPKMSKWLRTFRKNHQNEQITNDIPKICGSSTHLLQL